MVAITASVRGLRRVTVGEGPFVTQMEPKAVRTAPGVGIGIDTTTRLPAEGAVGEVSVPVVAMLLGDPHFPSGHVLLDEVHAVPIATNVASAHTFTAHLTTAVSTWLIAEER